MLKRNFSAALIAAGMLTIASMAQALVIDLIHNDSGTITNQNGSAAFEFKQQQSTGTGVIDPFLRVQNSPSEQGYNTSGGTPFDDKAGPWTHDIKFSDLQKTSGTLNGASYFKTLVNLNEPNRRDSTISHDKVQSFTPATGGATTANISVLGTLGYNLDGGGDNQVLFDAARNHASGSGDAYVYIPANASAGTNANNFVDMYMAYVAMVDSDPTSASGSDPVSPSGFGPASESGFGEVAMGSNMAPVPEMSALFPIVGLIVAVGSTHVLRRRRMAKISE